MSRLSDVVKNLIIINVIAYFGASMLADTYDSVISQGMLFPIKAGFNPFQLVTSMFMHGDLRHLFMNMLGLFFLGPTVERTLGPKRFLILYLAAGLGGSFFHLGFNYFSFLNTGLLTTTPALGASGCVLGVVLAFITMFPKEKLMIFPIPIPIKAMYLGIAAIGFSLYAGITDSVGGIAHFAHLGGALVGFIMVHYWKMANLR